MATPGILDRTQRAELARAVRREEILDAARRVFAEQGFRGTTIADIAEEARIALGTIYLYFPSKEDVFAALNQRLGEMILGAITEAPGAASTEDAVKIRIDNVFSVCSGNRDLLRLVVLNTDPDSRVAQRMRSAEEKRSQPIVDALTQGMDAGVIRNGDPAIMANLIRGLVTIAVYQAFVVSDGSDADRYREECAEMVSAYLRPLGG